MPPVPTFVPSPALGIAAAVLLSSPMAGAAVLFEDAFDSYSNGQLVGQGGWTGNAGSEVVSGQVQPFTNGSHDSVQHALALAHSPGQTLYFGFEVRDATDDSYVHALTLGPDTSIQWAGGSPAANIGIAGNEQRTKLTGETSSGLSLVDGQSYLVVGRLEFDAGGSETLTMWVDPSAESDSPAAINNGDLGWTQVTHVALSAVNHDGSSIVSLADKVIVATSFDEIVPPVPPQPSTARVNPFTAFDQVDPNYVMIVAHRCGYLSNGSQIFAENSLAAAAKSIALGVDVLETDVRMTSDGGLVLMHDSTVNRTTNGSGLVSAMTLAQITALRLKGPGGALTNEFVPTLADLMTLARGKVLVNLDKVDITNVTLRNRIMSTLIATDTVDHGMFKGGSSAAQVAAFRADYPGETIFFRPNLTDGSEATMIDTITSHAPPGVAINFSSEPTGMLSSTSVATAASYDTHIWSNTLWSSQCAGHHDAVALAGNPDGSWGWVIDQGVTMIQTDNAPQLIPYLESRNLRGSDLPPPELTVLADTGPHSTLGDLFFAIDNPLRNGPPVDDIVADSGSLFLYGELRHGGGFATIGLFPAASASTANGAVAFGRNNGTNGFAAFDYLDDKGASSASARTGGSPDVPIDGSVYTIIAEIDFYSPTTGTLRGWVFDGVNGSLDLASPNVETTFSSGFSTNPDELFVRLGTGSASTWANLSAVWAGDGTGATRAAAFAMLVPGQTYAGWALRHIDPSAPLLAEDDADGDGCANLLEYFGSSDPGDPGSKASYAIAGFAGDSLLVQYQRALDRPGVTVALQWSTDLTAWHASGETDGLRTIEMIESVISAPGSDPETIEATVQTTSGPTPENLFVRLAVR